MMAPAATSAGSSAKAGAFDVATLFVADKAARDEAALNLAAATKKEGVEFLGQIGYCDAVIKVSYSTTSSTPDPHRCARRRRHRSRRKNVPQFDSALTHRLSPTRSPPRSERPLLPPSPPSPRTVPLSSLSRTSSRTPRLLPSPLSSRLLPTRPPRSRMLPSPLSRPSFSR